MALPAPFDLIDLDIVGSTNDEAAQLAVAGAPAWTVVRARNQTAGRGRSGKSFASSAGNSYTSFILRPQGGPGQAAQLALVSGLAVAEDQFALTAPNGDQRIEHLEPSL